MVWLWCGPKGACPSSERSWPAHNCTDHPLNQPAEVGLLPLLHACKCTMRCRVDDGIRAEAERGSWAAVVPPPPAATGRCRPCVAPLALSSASGRLPCTPLQVQSPPPPWESSSTQSDGSSRLAEALQASRPTTRRLSRTMAALCEFYKKQRQCRGFICCRPVSAGLALTSLASGQLCHYLMPSLLFPHSLPACTSRLLHRGADACKRQTPHLPWIAPGPHNASSSRGTAHLLDGPAGLPPRAAA